MKIIFTSPRLLRQQNNFSKRSNVFPLTELNFLQNQRHTQLIKNINFKDNYRADQLQFKISVQDRYKREQNNRENANRYINNNKKKALKNHFLDSSDRVLTTKWHKPKIRNRR